MAKEARDLTHETQTVEADERYVHAHQPKGSDTKIVIVAVGASVTLFAIGLILGYLLGHQSSDSDTRGFDRNSTIMNNNCNAFQNQQRTSGSAGQSSTN